MVTTRSQTRQQKSNLGRAVNQINKLQVEKSRMNQQIRSLNQQVHSSRYAQSADRKTIEELRAESAKWEHKALRLYRAADEMMRLGCYRSARGVWVYPDWADTPIAKQLLKMAFKKNRRPTENL